MNDSNDSAGPDDDALRARVERALDLIRDFLTPEEIEEHRKMLTFLARTTPERLSAERPREVPDRSGTVEKPGLTALRTAMNRRSRSKTRGT